MRPPPFKMPGKLPSAEVACRNIKHLADKARDRLNGLSLTALIDAYNDGTPKWLTGSTVWLPAVYDLVDYDTDLDVVFQNQEACQTFIEGVMSRLKDYTLSSNRWGSGRIVHPDGKHVMDVWSLEIDETIAELLMSFPENHQRVACYLGWADPTPTLLTRIVKVRERMVAARTGGYRR